MIYGRTLRTAILWSAGASLLGQQVSGPILGYVWDSRIHQLRPLLGTPGAPSAGTPVESGETLAAAVSGAQRDFAVVLTGESRAAALLRPKSPATLRMLPGVHPGADRVELSPGGSAAAFYFPAEKLVQVVSGLPDRPGAPVDFSLLPLHNPMASFTVSDDGAVLLCVEVSGDGNDPPAAVVLSPAGDLSRTVLSMAVTAAAFLEGTHDALLANGQEFVVVRDAVVDVRRPLPTGTMSPTSLALTADGSRAILADGRTGLVAVERLDTKEEAPVVLQCHCHPTGLFRLNGEAVWRLDDSSRTGIRLLDLAGGQVRLLTVPPPIESR